jgi:hypothetical protein
MRVQSQHSTGLWRSYRLALVALAFTASLATLLAACGAAPKANKPHATTIPIATVASRVLYQADWKNGASAWRLASGWRITSNGLANDGLGAAPVDIPYRPTVADYTVTITLQVNAVVGKNVCGNTFGLEGHTLAGAIVYDAAILCVTPQLHAFANINSSNADGGFHSYDYTTGYESRVYVIKVQGQDVTYIYSGAFLGTVHCNQPTSPNILRLLNAGMDTITQSITITTP